MDQEECSTLMGVLQGIADPRQAHGQRYPWLFLLALVAAALASEQQTGHATAHWISLHAEELHERLRPPRASTPNESTLRRALRVLDIAVLEQRLGRQTLRMAAQAAVQGAIVTTTGEVLQGQAMDGKKVRGVRAYGQPLQLLSLVQHRAGRSAHALTAFATRLSLFSQHCWLNIADAIRHYDASVQDCLNPIGTEEA